MKFIVLVFCMCSVCLAQEKYFMIEGNRSIFYDTKSEPLNGCAFGYGWRWQQTNNIYFSFGLHALYTGAHVDNKKIFHSDYLYLIDADWKVGYLELPIVWDVILNSKKIKYFTATGFSVCLALADYSKHTFIKIKQKQNIGMASDYTFNEDRMGFEIFSNTKVNFCLGTGVLFNQHCFKGLIRVDFVESIDSLDGIMHIDHKFINFSLIYQYFI
jgi:hypothetical protein